MRRAWLRDALAVGVVAVFIALQAPEQQLGLVRIAIFGAGMVAAVRVIRHLAPKEPRSPDLFDIEPLAPQPQEIGAIRSIELDIQMATVHPFGVAWMTTLLRQLAAGRLMGKRGIGMERQPDAARQVLGAPLWRLVAPGEGRWPAGGRRMSAAEIEACVAALERV